MKFMLIIPKMPFELLTKDDLETFRKALLSDIKLLLSPQIHEHQEWLRCSDVRRMLKISTGTIQNLRISGKLKSQKVGGIHYYKLTDIENMISGKIK
ncbi:helix-turn-helix domain-containing protein [Mucilaginibacter antarcticus]|uniref:Helix-turn-helix domain-containing protein n=1 Tax=Mucilaginibacter antarcticus TaxID=1855725 RepID=A0ABW5XMS8_9SPHI